MKKINQERQFVAQLERERQEEEQRRKDLERAQKESEVRVQIKQSIQRRHQQQQLDRQQAQELARLALERRLQEQKQRQLVCALYQCFNYFSGESRARHFSSDGARAKAAGTARTPTATGSGTRQNRCGA
jgi:hypothetical protein